MELTSFLESLNPAINPNLNLFFPQPVLPSDVLSSEQVTSPPVMDSVGTSKSDLPKCGESEKEPPINDEPSSSPRSLISQHDDPNTHAYANTSVNNKPMDTTETHTLENNLLINQPLENNVKNATPQKTKVIVCIRCEVCKVDCNSKESYEKHKMGKKHMKNSKIHNTLIDENSETKRQKLAEGGGATVFFTRVCNMCKVVCNSQEMISKHLAGKKHAIQARKHTQEEIKQSVACNDELATRKSAMMNDITTLSLSDASDTIFPETGVTEDDSQGQNGNLNDENVDGGYTSQEDSETKKRKIMEAEVEKVVPLPFDDLTVLESGKNHIINIEKLRKIVNDITTLLPPDAQDTIFPQTGGEEDGSQGRNGNLKDEIIAEINALHEVSETKKRKIIEVEVEKVVPLLSVASNQDPVVSKITPMVVPQDNTNNGNIYSWCEVCNIYCTRTDILDIHKSGKKHLKNLKKLNSTKDKIIPASNDQSFKIPGADPEKIDKLNISEVKDDSGTKKRKIMQDGSDKITILPLDNKIMQSVTDPDHFAFKNTDSVSSGSKPSQMQTHLLTKCEICNIFCPSNDHLEVHNSGKKHLKKLMKTATLRNTDVSNDAPVMKDDTESKNHDLETKKQEKMEIKATRDNVQVCTICNVICNSQLVMDFHLVGQKHLKKMRKGPVLNKL